MWGSKSPLPTDGNIMWQIHFTTVRGYMSESKSTVYRWFHVSGPLCQLSAISCESKHTSPSIMISCERASQLYQLSVISCEGACPLTNCLTVYSRRYIQSCRYFRLSFVNCRLSNLLSGSILPPPLPYANKYTRIQCVRGGGMGFWASDRFNTWRKALYMSIF